jgi:DNA-binding winged helix-turn-helix (wHTH) protein/predicted ATPase
MPEASLLQFGPFRLDVANAGVWCGAEAFRLPPKAFAVLRMLVAHAGQIVTKEALLEAIWPDVVVSDAALAVCIGELRRTLGDTARAPQFIETVHRRGYRFIAPITRANAPEQSSAARRAVRPEPPLLVGREAELSQLHGWWRQAQRGERQLAFVTGEPGIGKTALLDAFVAQLDTETPLWTARGQCIAHYGAGEAYLPVLDAIGQLCREADGEQVLALLERYAPTWLVHLPALLSATELEALQRRVQGTTPERMLREIADALEALTAVHPLVLMLEDLHWSDMATIDLLAWLARRRQPGRLLLVGTYRPVDVIVRQHPLRAVTQELALHQLCAELPLELLSEAEVGRYLRARRSERLVSETLSSSLYERTEGNPLFLVTLVEALERQVVACDTLAEVEEALREVPQSLRGLIEQQLAQCTVIERRVLKAASVAGFSFAAAALVAGVGETGETIERCCATLASRGQFLRESGFEKWPDGTVTACYCFRHALYQQAIYEQLASSRRRRLHQQIGQQLETGFGAQVEERVAELAVHFERGRDSARAVTYHTRAGTQALACFAYAEAIQHLRTGLDLLEDWPDTSARTHQERALLVALGPALIVTRGQASADVERVYTRAYALAQHDHDLPQRFAILRGLWMFQAASGHLQIAAELGHQLFAQAQQARDSALCLEAHRALAPTCFFRGEFAAARTHAAHGLALYSAQPHQALGVDYGQDAGVVCRAFAAWTLWHLGYAEQALRQSQEAVALARRVSHPPSLALAHYFLAAVHQFRREVPAVQTQAAAAHALSTTHGFAWYAANSAIHQGWGLAMQGQEAAGLAMLRQGLAAYEATGAALHRTYFLALLAEVQARVGRVSAGLRTLTNALQMVHVTGERVYEAELHRLRGELLLARADAHDEAAACFHRALDTARRRQAKALELRAATSLSRLWRQQGKCQEAHDLLAPVYRWFGEGFDTADLQQARTLLAALA